MLRRRKTLGRILLQGILYVHDLCFLKSNEKMFKNLYPKKKFDEFSESFDKNAVDISTVIRSLFEDYVCENSNLNTDARLEDQEYSLICLHFATVLVKLDPLLALTVS